MRSSIHTESDQPSCCTRNRGRVTITANVPWFAKVTLVHNDLEMPEMDGFTLTRKIRADARFAPIPVIIHSSLSGPTNERHVKSAGADGYVAKFKVEDLAYTIKTVLEKRARSD